MNKYTVQAEVVIIDQLEALVGGGSSGSLSFEIEAHSESGAKERLADMRYAEVDWNLTVTDREIAKAQDDFVLETEEAGQ